MNKSPSKYLPFFSTTVRFKSPEPGPFNPVVIAAKPPGNAIFGKEKRDLVN